jgi:hypothetical protein
MAKTLLLVDGNYLFFLCRTLGVSQDFTKLDTKLAEMLGGAFDRKVFYTRPPRFDSAKPVLTWLRAHGWETHLYRYEQVSQDVLYNAMAVEIMEAAFSSDPVEVVVVSGSGTLIPVLSKLKERKNIKVTLVCTDDSTSEIVKGMTHITRMDLAEVLA